MLRTLELLHEITNGRIFIYFSTIQLINVTENESVRWYKARLLKAADTERLECSLSLCAPWNSYNS